MDSRPFQGGKAVAHDVRRRHDRVIQNQTALFRETIQSFDEGAIAHAMRDDGDALGAGRPRDLGNVAEEARQGTISPGNHFLVMQVVANSRE